MADRKTSELAPLTTPAAGDLLPVVDISEAALANRNKSITLAELFRGVPSGTAAAPSITIEGDENTGLFSPAADTFAVSTTGAERLRISPDGAVGLAGANYGTAGQVLTSAGSAAVPTWTTVSAGGSGDVVLASNNAFTGANTFTNTTGQIFRQAATQDGVLLRGRAGGTTSLRVEIVPTTLTANRTLIAPDVDGTLLTSGGALGTPSSGTLTNCTFPTLNQSTTGTAANVTGTVAIANGGTNATTAPTAITNLGATTLGSNIFTIPNPSAIRFPRFNADNTISALSDTDFKTALNISGGGTLSIVDADVNAAANIQSTKLSFTQTGTGATARTVDTKLKDIISIKDFGAIGNNITDDTTAVNNALANKPVYAPPGTYAITTANQASIFGIKEGPGLIKTLDNNLSARHFSNISAAPTLLSNHDNIGTAFNGDYSFCQFPVAHRITGAATLGQPTTGYLYRPEAMPHYTCLFNASGHNQGTSSNVGRTGVAAYRVKVTQVGQGDAVCFNGSVFVTGTKANSTNFLANPAGVLFNGDMQAGAAGVYMNPYETICQDGGFDVACVGIVNNFNRTVATGAKSAVWLGYRAQNSGSATCDALVSATGKWVTGLDLSMSDLNFGTNKAAISLKSNDRIYLNNNANASGNLESGWRTTGFNGDYITYSSALAAMQIVINGASAIEIYTNRVRVNRPVESLPSGSDPGILNGRSNGFGYPTGSFNSNSFNTATVTLVQLAEYVAALISRIHSSGPGGGHRFIGP